MIISHVLRSFLVKISLGIQGIQVFIKYRTQDFCVAVKMFLLSMSCIGKFKKEF